MLMAGLTYLLVGYVKNKSINKKLTINGDDMLNTVRYAMDTYYYSRNEFDAMVKRAMKSDVSWKNSAEQYLELYRSL